MLAICHRLAEALLASFKLMRSRRYRKAEVNAAVMASSRRALHIVPMNRNAMVLLGHALDSL
jgi:hypothetical protein